MGKRKHRFNFGRLKIPALLVAGAYMVLGIANYRSAMSAEEARARTLLEEKKALQHELAYHEHELDFIGTDEYIEQEARARLGWVRPDETVYVDSSQAYPGEDKERALATPTPTAPGPAPTSRPPVPDPAQRTASPSPSPADDSSDAQSAPSVSAAWTLAPEPLSTSTPKSIG